jgi:hypothetical protein
MKNNEVQYSPKALSALSKKIYLGIKKTINIKLIQSKIVEIPHNKEILP